MCSHINCVHFFCPNVPFWFLQRSIQSNRIRIQNRVAPIESSMPFLSIYTHHSPSPSLATSRRPLSSSTMCFSPFPGPASTSTSVWRWCNSSLSGTHRWPLDLLADKLLTHFSLYGEIEERLGFDKQTGKSKRFALFDPLLLFLSFFFV